MFIGMNGVNKQYSIHSKFLPILSDCTIAFEQNKSYAIMGPSGSGKTTILRMLAGIELHDSGEIFLYCGTKKRAIYPNDLSFVPQTSVLFDELTVIENIILASRIIGEAFNVAENNGYAFLERFGLTHYAQLWPYQLSGGMKQRICLIQALVRKPLFLLADEPMAHLDIDSKQQVLQLLLERTKMCNIGLIIATHDLNIARRLDITLRLDGARLLFYDGL